MPDSKDFDSVDARRGHPARSNDRMTSSNSDRFIPGAMGSFFTLDSIHFSNSQLGREDAVNISPRPMKLEVSEFQPNYFFPLKQRYEAFVRNTGAVTRSLFDPLKSVAKDAVDLLNRGAPPSSSVPFYGYYGGGDSMRKMMTESGNGRAQDNMDWELAAAKQSSDEDVLGYPIDRVREMFNGAYIGYYELPFFGNATVLNANGHSGWQVGNKGVSKSGAGAVGGVAQAASSVITGTMSGGPLGLIAGLGTAAAGFVGSTVRSQFPVDFPTVPQWKLENPIDGQPIEMSFILYNDSFDNLLKNFKFLHAFSSGSFWMYENTRIRSPNLFNIHLPGYFEMFFCAMNIGIANKGHVRRLYGNRINDFNSKVGTSFPQETMFPDGYVVSVSILPLVPNNFNMYLNYLKRGARAGTRIGQRSTLNGGREEEEVSKRLSSIYGGRPRLSDAFKRTGSSMKEESE